MSEHNGRRPHQDKLRPKPFPPGEEPELSEAARQLVDELIESNGGQLPTQEQLLKAARPKNSPLHRYYDWDDSISGGVRRPETVES